MRKFLAFLLLGILTLVGIGGAALGIAQSPNGVPIDKAVSNTLNAANYTEDLVEKTSQGSETIHLVFQNPDRLGGWIDSAGKRTYIFVIGTKEYRTTTQASSAPMPKTFYVQQVTGAKDVDPAQGLLKDYNKGTSTTNGDVTTVILTQQGQTATLLYTVTGSYVSRFKATAPGTSILLDITKVGTSPPVELPAGYKTTTTAPTSG